MAFLSQEAFKILRELSNFKALIWLTVYESFGSSIKCNLDAKNCSNSMLKDYDLQVEQVEQWKIQFPVGRWKLLSLSLIVTTLDVSEIVFNPILVFFSHMTSF